MNRLFPYRSPETVPNPEPDKPKTTTKAILKETDEGDKQTKPEDKDKK